MKEKYTQAFSSEKLYRLIRCDDSDKINPFNTDKINKPFYDFCDKWLPKDYAEHEEAWGELLDVFQEVEENAFSTGFEIALNLMK